MVYAAVRATPVPWAGFGIAEASGWAISSAGEHYIDIVGVTGSIPVSPTIFFLLFNPVWPVWPVWPIWMFANLRGVSPAGSYRL